MGNFDYDLISKVYSVNFVIMTGRYLLFAGLAYLIFWKWLPNRLQNYRIQRVWPKAEKLWQEFRFSMLTFFIFAAIGTGVFMATKAGYTKIYPNIDDHGMAYFWFSVVLAIVIHDAYFYFTHRLMHTKLLYAKFHAVHHRSNNPSPWAAFSFHPYEAVVEAMIVPLLAFTMPIHKFAILAFLVYMTFMNVIGHLGYELYPKKFVHSRWFFWNNTSTHHNMHHRKNNCNYGLYFNWWDRIFKTNHKTYFDYYDEVVARREAPLAARENKHLAQSEAA